MSHDTFRIQRDPDPSNTIKANEDYLLQCALCLNEYTNPKFLPCHHTFCKECIENLVLNTEPYLLRCPKCRQHFRLPSGGAAALQTNFYITARSAHGLCKTHPDKLLELVCSKCDVAICMKCMLSEHNGHRVKELDEAVKAAREKLLNHKALFEKTAKEMAGKLDQVEQNIKIYENMRQRLEEQVDERAATLRQDFNRILTECKNALLLQAQASLNQTTAAPLHDAKRHIEDGLSTVCELTQEVDTALNDNNSLCLLALWRDIAGGHGSQDQLKELEHQTPVQPVPVVQTTLLWTDNELPRDIMQKLLGYIKLDFQLIPLSCSINVQKQFQCLESEACYVHAINITCDVYGKKMIFVAQGVNGEGGAGRVAVVKPNGEPLARTKQLDISGRVGITRMCDSLTYKYLPRVEGKDFTTTELSPEDAFISCSAAATRRQYDVHNKGRARFLMRVHASGACDLRCSQTDLKVCDVTVKNPVAMDVSEDGMLIAVLEKEYTDVKLFHYGNSQPHAVYRADGQHFRPLDVCFSTTFGGERLVIADWLNDVLHVLDVTQGCKLIGHISSTNPELVKPTALYPDPLRQRSLWIGCQGGHVLTVPPILPDRL
jgi:hypothetical protein